MRMRTIDQALAYVRESARRVDEHIETLLQQGATPDFVAEELRRKALIEETLRAIEETRRPELTPCAS